MLKIKFFLLKILKFFSSKLFRVISYITKNLRVILIKNKTLILLLVICFISFYLFLIFSLVLGMMWLFLPSAYFLYHKRYKNIFIIWAFLFFSWYLFFTACMFSFDGPIIVRGDWIETWLTNPREVPYILEFVTDKFPKIYLDDSFLSARFRNLCIDSLVMLSLLSSTFGIPIYIPSIFKGLSLLYKLSFRG